MKKRIAIAAGAIAFVIVAIVIWAVVSVNAPNEDLERFNQLQDCKNLIDTHLPPAEVEWREARCDEFYGE